MAETGSLLGKGVWPWIDLGRMDYVEALDLQHRIVDVLVTNEATTDAQEPGFAGLFLFLEHRPVFTLGKRGGKEFLNVGEAWLAKQGIPVVATERGGFITYHGPGQLTVYPVVRLKCLGVSVMDFVYGLEAVMIRVLEKWGIGAERNEMNRGVWIGGKKIGSIGIHVRKGVAFHGLALNVNTDLRPFSWIQPCGLQGVAMTSIREITGMETSMTDVRRCMAEAFENAFHIRLKRIETLSNAGL